MKIAPPSKESLNPYYQSYLKYLKGNDLFALLKEQQKTTQNMFSELPQVAGEIVYAPGKWMLKEVVGHLADTERILCYRALRCARNDQTEMPAFDEDHYVKNANFHDRSLSDIAHELNVIRDSTISLISNLSEDSLDYKGKANGATISARIILYFIVVHQEHHLQVIKDRYLDRSFSG